MKTRTERLIYYLQNFENSEEPEEKSLNSKEMDIDDILIEIGEFGRSQILQVFILCLLMVPSAYSWYHLLTHGTICLLMVPSAYSWCNLLTQSFQWDSLQRILHGFAITIAQDAIIRMFLH